MSSSILTWLDYVIIGASLALSTFVGSIFGCFKKGTKGHEATEYLDGGHNLKVVPVSISICASAISSVGILGVVGETYEFGLYHFTGTVFIFVATIIGLQILPVFYNLQVSSIYEVIVGYFVMTLFNKQIRTLTSALFILESILYPSVVAYCSSLALTQMSGINLHVVNAVSCGVCIAYTMLGGIKGVIWTDTLQAWAMVGSMLAIIYFATNDAGGISHVVETLVERKYTNITFDPNPFMRTSFWTAFLGYTWYTFASTFFNQSNVQRFNALSSFSDVKYTCYIIAFGCTFLLWLSHALSAVVLVALYKDCDPIKTHEIHKSSEIAPYYIIHSAHKIPGLTGIFIAGLFCAGLSTMSAKMNSAAGVIYNDFISQFYRHKISDKTAVRIMKTATVLLGLFYILMGFLIDQMGPVTQLCLSFQGICYGAMTGVFTLALLVPQCNVKGAYVGGVVGAIVIGIICVGNQASIANGSLRYQTFTSVDGCANSTYINPDEYSEKLDVFFLYKLSFMYYCLFGTLITVFVGYVVSYFTGHQDLMTLNPEYVAPCLQNWLREKQKSNRPTKTDVELKLLSEIEDAVSGREALNDDPNSMLSLKQ